MLVLTAIRPIGVLCLRSSCSRSYDNAVRAVFAGFKARCRHRYGVESQLLDGSVGPVAASNNNDDERDDGNESCGAEYATDDNGDDYSS
ncbi:hypothetical protein DL764_002986 [Monosporascus ibericus]|uniref:Uncharacterized protein n=1 Tax=Monosporascus ibericus TaxID=155417 RepID=A0A4Q4TKU5_9PEZI|nr:hypothetical protein DL764_002986 [Monosporascus ibericus]